MNHAHPLSSELILLADEKCPEPVPQTMITLQSFEERSVLSGGSRSILITSLPVGPVGDILETLVEASVLHVLGAQYASSATRIHDIVKRDLPEFLRALDLEGGADGFARIEILLSLLNLGDATLKIDGFDLNTVEYLGSTVPSMFEHEVVRLRANNVPSIAIGTISRNEVSV